MEIVIVSGLRWDWFHWETLCGVLMKLSEIDVRALWVIEDGFHIV